ncbi:MAG TPA: hypothetical protein PK402_07055 [Tepidisphaeraceae bacterium]|nr:hypothetical protein [Tepidisphaeraceae bacterium]
MGIVGVIIGVIALMIVFGVISGKVASKRRAAMLAFAQQFGLEFFPDRDSSIASRFCHFNAFDQGFNRYGYNTMRGHVEAPNGKFDLTAGDFHYEPESKDSKGNRQRQSHYFSYAIFQPPFVMRPKMTMRRETFVDRVGGAIGFDDIDFENDAFSRKFHIKSDDRKFCYDLLDPRMIEWIMSTEPPNLVIAGGQLLVTWKGTWKVEEFSSNIEWLRQFVSKMPTHLVDRLDDATPPNLPPPPIPSAQ